MAADQLRLPPRSRPMMHCPVRFSNRTGKDGFPFGQRKQTVFVGDVRHVQPVFQESFPADFGLLSVLASVRRVTCSGIEIRPPCPWVDAHGLPATGSTGRGPLRATSTNQSSGGIGQQPRPEMMGSCGCPCSGQHHLAIGFAEGSHQCVDTALQALRGRPVSAAGSSRINKAIVSKSQGSCPGPA